MNKKGDITITIFVIGVVALCFFALISFYVSNLDSSDNFSNIQLIQKIKTKIDSNSEIDGNRSDGVKYYREKAVVKDYWFFGQEKVMLEVNYYLD